MGDMCVLRNAQSGDAVGTARGDVGIPWVGPWTAAVRAGPGGPVPAGPDLDGRATATSPHGHGRGRRRGGRCQVSSMCLLGTFGPLPFAAAAEQRPGRRSQAAPFCRPGGHSAGPMIRHERFPRGAGHMHGRLVLRWNPRASRRLPSSCRWAGRRGPRAVAPTSGAPATNALDVWARARRCCRLPRGKRCRRRTAVSGRTTTGVGGWVCLRRLSSCLSASVGENPTGRQ